MKHYLPVIILIILLSWSFSFAADTATAKKLSLNECISIALQNNSDIKASEEDKKRRSLNTG